MSIANKRSAEKCTVTRHFENLNLFHRFSSFFCFLHSVPGLAQRIWCHHLGQIWMSWTRPNSSGERTPNWTISMPFPSRWAITETSSDHSDLKLVSFEVFVKIRLRNRE